MGRGLATLGGLLGTTFLGAAPFFLGMGYTLYDVLRHDSNPIPLMETIAAAWM